MYFYSSKSLVLYWYFYCVILHEPAVTTYKLHVYFFSCLWRLGKQMIPIHSNQIDLNARMLYKCNKQVQCGIKSFQKDVKSLYAMTEKLFRLHVTNENMKDVDFMLTETGK